MANEEGYSQTWQAGDFNPEEVAADSTVYEVETDEFDQSYIMETRGGIALVGYREKSDEVVFTGSRSAANDAYEKFNQELGTYRDHTTGLGEDQLKEPFENFHEIASDSSDDLESFGIRQALEEESKETKKIAAE